MSFEEFLDSYIPMVKQKSKQVNQAIWLMETTGSTDAAELKAALETELRLLFNDKKTFDRLIEWDKDPSLTDPILKRELNVLIRRFKPNLIEKKLLEKIAQKEAQLAVFYTNFRPILKDQELTENAIKEILKNEIDVDARKEAWEASKQIGKALAPGILELVALRNQAARSLGYRDYFAMELEMQEVDEKWLFEILDRVAERSDDAYTQVVDEIQRELPNGTMFQKMQWDLGAGASLFAKKDPLDVNQLDQLVKKTSTSSRQQSDFINQWI